MQDLAVFNRLHLWINIDDQQLSQPLALLHRITAPTAMHRKLKNDSK
jgi:hypothetical protein